MSKCSQCLYPLWHWSLPLPTSWVVWDLRLGAPFPEISSGTQGGTLVNSPHRAIAARLNKQVVQILSLLVALGITASVFTGTAGLTTSLTTYYQFSSQFTGTSNGWLRPPSPSRDKYTSWLCSANKFSEGYIYWQRRWVDSDSSSRRNAAFMSTSWI